MRGHSLVEENLIYSIPNYNKVWCLFFISNFKDSKIKQNKVIKLNLAKFLIFYEKGHHEVKENENSSLREIQTVIRKSLDKNSSKNLILLKNYNPLE
jgi:hypothetical protein